MLTWDQLCALCTLQVTAFISFMADKTGKGKAIPITGLCGPKGSGRLRLQISRHSAHEGGKVTRRPPLPPGISWYMDLSDAWEKILSDMTGDRSRDLPTSSAAP